MERIIAINNYVVVGTGLMVGEAEEIVLDFMHDEDRRGEQRPMLEIESEGRKRQLWLRIEWEKLGDIRPYNWEQ